MSDLGRSLTKRDVKIGKEYLKPVDMLALSAGSFNELQEAGRGRQQETRPQGLDVPVSSLFSFDQRMREREVGTRPQEAGRGRQQETRPQGLDVPENSEPHYYVRAESPGGRKWALELDREGYVKRGEYETIQAARGKKWEGSSRSALMDNLRRNGEAKEWILLEDQKPRKLIYSFVNQGNK
jgi:hypothetical protein